MKPVCQLIGLVLLATLVFAVLGAAVFIGVGALLSQWLPLSLFHASSLAIGAALTIAIIIHALTAMIHFQSDHTLNDDDFDWEPDDDADGTPDFPEPDVPKVGRNEPCPCGSGRKFKNCCGKSTPQ